MAQGPSIQGQIVINTQSVDKAITSVKKLQTNVQKSFGLGGQAAASFSKTLDKQTQAYNKVAQSNQKYQNIIAKAANQVANYEAAVRKSNATDAKKASLIKAATSELKGFEQAVKGGATSGKSLDNVSTQLSVSMGQLKRDLSSASKAQAEKIKTAKQLEQAQIRTDKAVSQSSIQYEKAARAVRDSGMAEADKLNTLRKLDAEHKKLTQTLTSSTASTRQASAAQNRFRETLSQVNAESRKSRMTQQAAATNKYAAEMRNLSTSVVVALGPLSGVASRLTALTTLFNRNAASIAVVLASMTALSVAFARSAQVAEEAEKQMFRINAQLGVLGDSAQITGDEINNMAHSIAASTLLSAKEVRDATGALLQFGGIGRSQYEDVTKAAQGMSVVVGGNLTSNIRKLGRAIDDPTDGIQRLERYGVILTDSVTKNIQALSAQGRKMEATSVLLKELTGLQKAAEGEALGLAGAYDTVSGNLDKLMEDLFINSDAAEAMAQSVMNVANAIKEFGKSAQAEALGALFEKIASAAGSAFQLAIGNINVFGGALAFIIGSTVPKAIVALTTLGMSGLRAVWTSSIAAAGAVRSFSIAQGTATASTKAFTVALLSNPLTAIAVGIAAVTAAWWQYHDVITEIEDGRANAQNAVISSVKAELEARMDLTKTQADLYKEEGQALQERQNKHAAQINKMVEKEAELESKAESVLGALAMERRGPGRMETYITTTEKLTKLLDKDLTDAQRSYIKELLATRQRMDDIEESAENVDKKVKELLETISSGDPAKEITPAMEALENQLETMKKLSKEFLPDISKMDELETKLAQAQGLAQGLARSMAEVPNRSEEATVAFERAKQVVKEIKKEMQELNEVEISKEVVKFKEALRDAAMEANKLSDLAGADEAVKPFIELNYEMEKLKQNVSETVEEMDAEAVAQFAKAMGMSGAGSDDVVKEFVARMKAEKERAIEAKKIAAAHETIDSFQKSQLTQTQALKDEYKDLYSAAVTSGNTEDLPKISEWFKKEQAKIEAQASQTASTPFTNLETLEQEFMARQELLASLYADDEAKYQEHLDRMKQQAEKNRAFMSFAQGAEQAADVVGGAMEAMQAAGKENSAAYQAMAISQAIINAALAVSQVLADETLPTYGKIAMAGVIGATAGAQIAQIRSQNYATGGYVSGPGSSTSDSISANLSNGEFVVQAQAVRDIGRRNLEMMNSGHTPSFNTGGSVGMSPKPVGSLVGGGSPSGINFTVIDNSSGDKQYRAEEGTDQNGNREIKLVIDNVVKQGINSGQYDRQMGNRFGVKHKGRKV